MLQIFTEKRVAPVIVYVSNELTHPDSLLGRAGHDLSPMVRLVLMVSEFAHRSRTAGLQVHLSQRALSEKTLSHARAA